jgi:hypothetical protein
MLTDFGERAEYINNVDTGRTCMCIRSESVSLAVVSVPFFTLFERSVIQPAPGAECKNYSHYSSPILAYSS